MQLGKESIFVWAGLAVISIIIAILLGGKASLHAAGDEQAVDGVSLVPIQLGRESYGLAMVDPKSESIWIYEINNRGAAHTRLKLFAARSWHYDKMLEEFNSAEPKPQQVKNMIDQMLRPSSAAQPEANSVDITSMAEPNQKTEDKQKTE